MTRDLSVLAPGEGDPAAVTRALRRAFGAFATGVTVVTTCDESGQPFGFTANSFTSVSLDPPLLLVCLAKSSSSLETFRRCTGFAVNILSEGQEEISRRFASRRADRFDGVAAAPGGEASPILADTSAWFDCALKQCVDAGDHVILIGRVNDFGASERAPLIYLQGAYRRIEAPADHHAVPGASHPIQRLITTEGLQA